MMSRYVGGFTREARMVFRCGVGVSILDLTSLDPIVIYEES